MDSWSLDEQRRVTQLALDVLEGDGFALAGSGAIREHGFTQRPTQDVDLFTIQSHQEQFSPAVDRMVERFEHAGYVVAMARRQESFAQLTVTSREGLTTEVDLGVDWRSLPAVRLGVGPVLAAEDAVANKVCALYSRGEVRDFLDVDAIRQDGRFSDSDLQRLAMEADPGFEPSYFADRLARVVRIQPSQVADFGVTVAQLDQVKQRYIAWEQHLRHGPTADKPRVARGRGL